MSLQPPDDFALDVENAASANQQLDSEEHPPDENQDQNWLTIRRRCELCKQRKVCLSALTVMKIHSISDSSNGVFTMSQTSYYARV